jgi:hypothetical protein
VILAYVLLATWSKLATWNTPAGQRVSTPAGQQVTDLEHASDLEQVSTPAQEKAREDSHGPYRTALAVETSYS